MISAKGKGTLQTYWVTSIKAGQARSVVSSLSLSSTSDLSANHAKPTRKKLRGGNRRINLDSLFQDGMSESSRKARLVHWNAQLLGGLIKQIEAERQALRIVADSEEELRDLEKMIQTGNGNKTVLDEVVEIVNLPNFNAHARRPDPNSIKLPPEAMAQLSTYIAGIADMYQANPFHNFSHASHVTQSVSKLLGRIVAPDLQSDDAKDLHDHTYGITSDPLTQFAVVLSALLHDVDHAGVPNNILVEEQQDVAAHYKNKSVAEQNSIDLAWDYLMEDCFVDLRRALYTTKEDCMRFRQLLVNTILATDIMDKELKALRNERWDKAFTEEQFSDDSDETCVNRKATIVIEHLIQASDVSHTMQHWHVFRKWNECLFFEMYQAYKEGRSKKNPLDFWYEGEIGFFDFYIIPLAKKLESCGVFGVSSHEYLDYAKRNRAEWELKGRAVVEELREKVESMNFDERCNVVGDNKA